MAKDLPKYARTQRKPIPHLAPFPTTEQLYQAYQQILAPAYNSLGGALQKHNPADNLERLAKIAILREIETNPFALSPHCPSGHLTGSALVVDPNTQHALLHSHKSLGRLLQFGGHTEAGEVDLLETARREAREESGYTDLVHVHLGEDPILDIDAHTIPAKGTRAPHTHFDIRYLLYINSSKQIKKDEGESNLFRWIPLDPKDRKAIDLEPSVLRLLNKAYLTQKDTK